MKRGTPVKVRSRLASMDEKSNQDYSPLIDNPSNSNITATMSEKNQQGPQSQQSPDKSIYRHLYTKIGKSGLPPYIVLDQ